MMSSRPETGPVVLLTSQPYDAQPPSSSQASTADADIDMDDISDSSFPQRRSIPSLESIHKESRTDPLSMHVLSSSSSANAASSSSRSPFANTSGSPSTGPTPFTATPINTPTRQRSASTAFGADEIDDGDGSNVFRSPALGSTPKKSRTSALKSKREELSDIVRACTQDTLQARIKVEEERTKREEMRIQFAREESKRAERMRIEERRWIMDLMQMVNSGLQLRNINTGGEGNANIDPFLAAMNMSQGDMPRSQDDTNQQL